MLDLELLRTFVAVVDTGSYTRAAAQIHRTQSAVSMQMKRLEQQLEKNLLISDKRELQLTEDGMQLIGYARRMLKLHDEALGVMRSSNGYRPLLLGCPDDYVTAVLPVVMAEVRKQFPSLQVKVRSGSSTQLRQWMDSGELDLAILTRAVGQEEGYLLMQDKGIWIAPSENFLEQHKPIPMALVESDCKFNTTAVDGLQKQGREFDLICITGNCSLLLELVRRGDAVSTMVRCAVPGDIYRVPDSVGLPELPTVEIVLQPAASSHPAMGLDRLAELAECSAAHLADIYS